MLEGVGGFSHQRGLNNTWGVVFDSDHSEPRWKHQEGYVLFTQRKGFNARWGSQHPEQG